jgi:hypothetical protein
MNLSKKVMLIVAAALLAGAVLTTAIRFALYKDDKVHYHANFALYVNGTRDMFAGPGFYEEVATCDSHEVDNPKVRVHMHDENPGLVHVHAHGVTWGQLFDNLGYSVSSQAITTTKGVFVDGQDANKLTYEINGQSVSNVANLIIKSEDKLLINYGQDDATTIAKHYSGVPSDAHKANTEQDPAACSGSKPVTFTERLKIAVGAR